MANRSTDSGIIIAALGDTSPELTEEDVKATADIINFIVNGKELQALEQQLARALPNEQLKIVFGIDNAFTTQDVRHKRTFTNETIRLMNMATKIEADTDKGDWTTLRERAIAYCYEYLEHPTSSSGIKLAGLVQFITLKLSLFYLFPDKAQLTGDAFEDIVNIGRRINTLWLESKKEDIECPRWENEKVLHQALDRVLTPNSYSWFPLRLIYSLYEGVCSWRWATELLLGTANKAPVKRSDPRVPKQNPMNLILPAYETMWRVVLRCLLEIRYRGAERGNAWSDIMKQYLEDLQDPKSMNDKVLWKAMLPTNVRPMDIVKEALRLYPPTRRVHRHFDGKSVPADIEECHWSELLAKSEPLVFSPERWQEFERSAKEGETLRMAEERLGFMPFAFHCPSSKQNTRGFGFKMIALLVAVLCDSIDERWKPDADADVSLFEREHPLDSAREAYQNLRLEKS